MGPTDAMPPAADADAGEVAWDRMSDALCGLIEAEIPAAGGEG
jgi:hypothetical protein